MFTFRKIFFFLYISLFGLSAFSMDFHTETIDSDELNLICNDFFKFFIINFNPNHKVKKKFLEISTQQEEFVITLKETLCISNPKWDNVFFGCFNPSNHLLINSCLNHVVYIFAHFINLITEYYIAEKYSILPSTSRFLNDDLIASFYYDTSLSFVYISSM